MARDQEVTAKFAVQEAQVKYERAVAAAAGNRGNGPDAKRDQAAVAKAKAELDAAVAMSKDPRNAVAPTAIEASSYNVRSTVGDELLKKQAAIAAQTAAEDAARKARAELDPDVIAARKLAAEAAAEVAATDKSKKEAEANLIATKAANAAAGFTPKPVSTPVVDNFQASVDAAAGMDSSSYAVDADGDRTSIDNVPFAGLTPEEQAAIGNIGEQGLATTSNITTEAPGKYTFDPKTGILLLDGQPYTGSYNGFDYESGNKKDATTKQIVDLNTEDNPLELTGPTDAELARLDAFAQLQDLFESYNLGSLAGKITEYMKAGKGPNETVLLLKKSPEYNLRFQGNTLRLASGLNVMSEASYLELEDSYANTLRAYGLGNMLSPDRTKNEAMFAKYMGNDLNAPEFKNRIALATERVINADAMTKGLFKEFYPNLTDSDLVAYFLAPKDTLSRLQEKVTSAEIGTAAIAQGLETSMASATDLAKFGIDKDAAIKGYSEIQEVLPTSQKLGNVYQEAGIKYDQATGEAEFFKQNQDAKLKRKRLESLERGSFSGSAGNAPGAYSTGYLKKSSVAGLI